MSKRTRRPRLIKSPDLEAFRGATKEGLDDHQLRNNTITVPDRLYVAFYARIPNAGKTRGILSAVMTRVLNQINNRLDQEGLTSPGEETNLVFKHIVEKELTPLADNTYES